MINEYYLTGLLRLTHGSRIFPVEYTYDAQGRMKTMTTWTNFANAQGAAITTWDYDPQRGFITQKRYANSQGPVYTQTPGGRPPRAPGRAGGLHTKLPVLI